MARSQAALPASAMAGILRDAALYALVTFGLFVPIIAYRTDPGPGSELVLVPRWGLVASLCLAIFLARIAQRPPITPSNSAVSKLRSLA